MSTTIDKITDLTKLGIDFNTELIGDAYKWGLLRDIKSFEYDGDVENWIILREMGNVCIWDAKNNTLKTKFDNDRYSKDVSTIHYEQYFFYNRISTLFEELKRITKGAFQYEVIDEFLPIYDSNGNEIARDFWLGPGVDTYLCKYRIMGKDVEIKYDFYERNTTYLISEFVLDLIELIKDELIKLNVYCLSPEEFLTFISCTNETKNKLANEYEVYFYNYRELKENEESKEKENEEENFMENGGKKWYQFWK